MVITRQAFVGLLVVSVVATNASASVLDDPGEKDPNCEKAVSLIQKGELEVARALLSIALKQYPESIAVLTSAADLAQKQKRNDDATGFCKKALQLESQQRKLIEAFRKSGTPKHKALIRQRDRRIEKVYAILRETAPATEALLRHATEMELEAQKMNFEQRRTVTGIADALRDRAFGVEGKTEGPKVSEVATPTESAEKPEPAAAQIKGGPIATVRVEYAYGGAVDVGLFQPGARFQSNRPYTLGDVLPDAAKGLKFTMPAHKAIGSLFVQARTSGIIYLWMPTGTERGLEKELQDRLKQVQGGFGFLGGTRSLYAMEVRRGEEFTFPPCGGRVGLMIVAKDIHVWARIPKTDKERKEFGIAASRIAGDWRTGDAVYTFDARGGVKSPEDVPLPQIYRRWRWMGGNEYRVLCQNQKEAVLKMSRDGRAMTDGSRILRKSAK